MDIQSAKRTQHLRNAYSG